MFCPQYVTHENTKCGSGNKRRQNAKFADINYRKGMEGKMYISTTEEMILNYKALPPEMDGWRRYRIEYGGHAEACIKECVIYVPPKFDIMALEKLFEDCQEDEAEPCPHCHGTGFKDGQICGCISGKVPEIPQELKDIFGGVFMDKKRGE